MKKPLLIIILLLVSMVSMFRVGPVRGQVYTTLYVNPPSIIDTTKTTDSTFTVDINIKNVTDLYGFEFFLNYTTTVLTATNVTRGTFFPSDAMIWHNETNDDLGYVWYGVGLPLGSPAGVTGSGTLANINFTVDSIGESRLDLFNTKLSDRRAERIPHKVYEGYFSNILRPTKLYVDPENTIDPDLVEGESFTVNVDILNATDLYGFEFFLNYTTTVLTATNVTVGTFFPSGSQIVREEINDTLGYVRYNVTIPFGSPAGVTGSGTLANINFTVDSIGESRLDLFNTKLVDSAGERIEHDTMDGFFSNIPITHDIAITDIKTTVTTTVVIENVTYLEPKLVNEVQAGKKLNITVYVKNNGTVTENFDVTVYYSNITISTRNITLSEDFSEALTFEWSTEGVAQGSYIIWAEASVVAGETNTANNKFIREGEFKVSSSGLPFPTIAVAAAIIVLVIAAIAVYFIKIRKPKPA